MTKTRKKRKRVNVLGGRLYIVEARGTGHVVKKNPKEGELPEEYFVDAEGACECAAADYGNDCKHIKMASRTLQGKKFAIQDATEILETHLDVFRAKWPLASIVSLLVYQKVDFISLAPAYAHGVLSDEYTEDEMTMWLEVGKLLIGVRCFKEKSAYRKALRTVRNTGGYKKPDLDVGPIGKTYGNEGD